MDEAKHLMIGLETWHAVRSIGAVPFNPYTGYISNSGQSFYQSMNYTSQSFLGLEKDSSTAEWWEGPELKNARDLLEVDELYPGDVMILFDKFLKDYAYDPMEIKVWTRGNMDMEVLEDMYDVFGVEFPFHFRNFRDSRTILGLWDHDEENLKNVLKGEPNTAFEGIPHYALDDARHECKLVCNAYRLLGWTS